MTSSKAPTASLSHVPRVPWLLSSRWHLFGTLFVTLALPISGLAWLVGEEARRTLHDQAIAENTIKARLAGELIFEHFHGLMRFVEGVARGRNLRDAVLRRDIAAVQRHLSDVVGINPTPGRVRPAFDRALLTDPSGTEWADWPTDPEVHGKNFALRDWYQGVRRTHQTYVSEIYLRQGRPRKRVVSVATPIYGPDDQTLIGYLVAQNPTENLAQWLAGPHSPVTGTLALTDIHGQLAASSIGPSSRGEEPGGSSPGAAGPGGKGGDADRQGPADRRAQSGRVPPGPAARLVRPGQPAAGDRFRAGGRLDARRAVPGAGVLPRHLRRRHRLARDHPSFPRDVDRTHRGARRSHATPGPVQRRAAQLAADLEVTTASVRQAHQELQRTEVQLIQAERLSALGKMVEGVAHEINNPLAFVSNNVAVLQRDAGYLYEVIQLYQQAESTLAEHQRTLLERIRSLADQVDLPYVLDNMPAIMARSREGLKRIQQIVADLRDFARLDEADLQNTDLNEGVRSTLLFLRHRAIERSAILEDDPGVLPLVTCYAAKINQVVFHLVNNAIEACPREGRVVVSTCSSRGGRRARMSAITAAGSTPAFKTGSSTPSSPPNPSARGPAWACPSATGSSAPTAAGSRSNRPSARGAASR